MARLNIAVVAVFAYIVAARAETSASDIVGVYEKIDTSAFLDSSHCPPTLRFSDFFYDQFKDEDFDGFDFFNIKIPHRSRKIGATQCTSSGAMWAIDASHPNVKSKPKMLEDWATAHGSPFRTWLAGEDFLQLAAEENFILGYDYSELKCGKKIIRAGTEYLWFEPPFAINPHEDFELEKKEKYILVTHTNWDADFGCVYKAGEVGGGPQSDPSREEDFALAASGETTSAAASLEPEEEEEDKEEKEDDDAPDDDVDVSGGVFGGSDSSSSTKSGGSCFPEGATVELEDGSSKSMRHLVAGDRVKIGADSFSDVFMFTHKLPDLVSPFVRLETASGKSISLSPGHYLYAGGSLVAADAVQMGDELTLADGSQSRVVSIVEEHKRGLYNPQTLHGDIVVDGVVTSTYTTAVQPSFAHSVLLGPARALYRAQLGRWLNGLLDAGASRLVRWLPSGSSVAA